MNFAMLEEVQTAGQQEAAALAGMVTSFCVSVRI
jgi:hypothetical protein